jgi:hypothetical protein
MSSSHPYEVFLVMPQRSDGELPGPEKARYGQMFYTEMDALGDACTARRLVGGVWRVYRALVTVVEEVSDVDA